MKIIIQIYDKNKKSNNIYTKIKTYKIQLLAIGIIQPFCG